MDDHLLPPINQGIQAAHAVVELFNIAELHKDNWGKLYEWAENDKTLVLLSMWKVKPYDGSDIEVVNRAISAGYPYTLFREPDLKNRITAIAFYPMTKRKAKDIFYGFRQAK